MCPSLSAFYQLPLTIHCVLGDYLHGQSKAQGTLHSYSFGLYWRNFHLITIYSLQRTFGAFENPETPILSSSAAEINESLSLYVVSASFRQNVLLFGMFI